MLGAALLALATAIGALGAHALKARLAVDRYEVLQTAVHYQFFNALGLLGVGLLLERERSRLVLRGGAMLLWGVVLFCGSLYLLVASAPSVVGFVTPVGGVLLIAGWVTVAWGLRAPRPPLP
jgi:uncharacterized membrane protein YgdD (TMEM256/DUF423 family)